MTTSPEPGRSDVASIISDAGGRVVGRTKLQKIAYFLEAAGLGSGFDFEYRHYGPYSEDLTDAARLEKFFGDLEETEAPASWGGTYSIYTTSRPTPDSSSPRKQLISITANADSIALELAATAAFLAAEGHPEPWEETARRKPEKASSSRLGAAKTLYCSLLRIRTPRALPSIL